MKKYINTDFFAKITVLVFVLFSTFANAQTDLPEAPDDTATAPIDNYVWVLAFVGFIFVFLKLRTLIKQ